MNNGLPVNQIIEGDCLEVMNGWPDGCVHCVVTSPPYWGLRDYKIEPSVWVPPGADSDQWAACEHEWGCEQVNLLHRKPHNGLSNAADKATPRKNPRNKNRAEDGSIDFGSSHGQWCRKCGAWRGCYGLEPTPELFVEHTVTIFREVRRVLRDDGTLWLNLGDSYSSERWGQGQTPPPTNTRNKTAISISRTGPGLKPKDLVGIPWRVAFALQADGWYLRQDIIWHKPNPMPESVTDRCTKAHEYLFLLAKSPRYFYDAEAIKEEGTGQNGAAADFHRETKDHLLPGQSAVQHRIDRVHTHDSGTRNKRSVWTIATAPFKEAHFATFPPELVRPCIRAGTSAKGCCPECGAPWKRVIEQTKRFESGYGRSGNQIAGKNGAKCQGGGDTGDIRKGPCVESRTIGWKPSCSCNAGGPVPCVVLDPFGGSGTTGMVAAQEHRDYVMIERNPKYVEMARTTRLAAVETAVPAAEAKAGQLALFEGRT